MSSARIGLKNPGFLISLTLLLEVVLLYFLKFQLLEVIELKILDTHFRLRGVIPPGGDVVIAAISDSTYQQVEEKALVKSLDSVMVKGKTKPVLIYELLGMNTGDDSLPRISGDPSGEGCGKREKL